MFSMAVGTIAVFCRFLAVGTIGEWLKVVPFLLGHEQLQLVLRGGGGGSFF